MAHQLVGKRTKGNRISTQFDSTHRVIGPTLSRLIIQVSITTQLILKAHRSLVTDSFHLQSHSTADLRSKVHLKYTYAFRWIRWQGDIFRGIEGRLARRVQWQRRSGGRGRRRYWWGWPKIMASNSWRNGHICGRVRNGAFRGCCHYGLLFNDGRRFLGGRRVLLKFGRVRVHIVTSLRTFQWHVDQFNSIWIVASNCADCLAF